MTSTRELPGVRGMTDYVEGVLDSIAFLQVFRSDVPDDVALSSDGKANGYVVLYPGVPIAHRFRLAPQPDSKSWTFQITAVGGDDNRCLRVVDLVTDAIVGLRVPVGDKFTTPIYQEPSGPDAVQIDRGINPPRFWLPLIFRCRV